jgi:hypothetical protein
MRFLTVVAAIGPALLGAQLRAQRPAIAVVSGTVVDSIAHAPLGRATVQLFGTSGPASGRMLSTTADSLGAFRLDSVPLGEYVAGFFHPAMDSLGIEVKSRAVRIESARQRIDFGSPGPSELISAFCGAEELKDSTALLIGHVRGAESEQPIVGADVLLEWIETAVERGRNTTILRTAAARTVGGGFFALCGVPTGFALLTRAAFGGDTTGFVEHESALHGVSHVSFLIGHARLVALAEAADTLRMPGDTLRVLRGEGRLLGLVLSDKGQPVRGAQVGVEGTGLVATTNEAGRFVLDSLPPGTRTATIRAIGFTPTQHAVHIADGRATTMEFRFPQRAVLLGTMTVTSEQVYSRKLREFESHRRRSVGGVFFQPSAETGTEYMTLATMVKHSPNMEVIDRNGEVVVFNRVGRGRCQPSLWLDGERFRLGFDALSTQMGVGDILAVEIYPRPIGMPAQYSEAGCGAISVWSKPLPAAQKKPD